MALAFAALTVVFAIQTRLAFRSDDRRPSIRPNRAAQHARDTLHASRWLLACLTLAAATMTVSTLVRA